MKKRLIFIILLLGLSTLFSNNTFAQNNYELFRSFDELPDWVYQKRASYDFMKEAFFKVYGSDPSGWPHFIKEAIRLNDEYQKYEKKNGKEGYILTSFFFTEIDSLAKIERPNLRGGAYNIINQSVLRNYYPIFTFYYPVGDNYGKLEPVIDRSKSDWIKFIYNINDFRSTEEGKISASYHYAAISEGILPAILYLYAYTTPPRLLEWHFKEIFPVIDHLFKNGNFEERLKIFESIYNHIGIANFFWTNS